ncbi:transcription antitermination factor NusB [Mycoplasmatota bacterium]|nr:transcription antitermination factor NusB [Mycoplasmatota bacterium]
MNNITKRRQEREAIVSVLYMIDLTHCNLKEAYLAVDISDYIIEMVEGVMNHLNEIDEIITNNLTNWSIKRLNFVDRAIIRLAVYEMLYVDLDKSIIINEAVELSKKYSETDDLNSKAFNNKLLDKIHKQLKMR